MGTKRARLVTKKEELKKNKGFQPEKKFTVRHVERSGYLRLLTKLTFMNVTRFIRLHRFSAGTNCQYLPSEHPCFTLTVKLGTLTSHVIGMMIVWRMRRLAFDTLRYV